MSAPGPKTAMACRRRPRSIIIRGQSLGCSNQPQHMLLAVEEYTRIQSAAQSPSRHPEEEFYSGLFLEVVS
jgi:hypothetical protein